MTEDNHFVPLHRARRPEVEESFRATPDAGLLRERLDRLLQALDRMLDDPVRIERAPSSHTVWVFEQIGYRVSRRGRGVYGVLKVGGRAVPLAFRMSPRTSSIAFAWSGVSSQGNSASNSR